MIIKILKFNVGAILQKLLFNLTNNFPTTTIITIAIIVTIVTTIVFIQILGDLRLLQLSCRKGG
jgi:hypothetical protein